MLVNDPISKHMTRMPHSIEPHQSAQSAKKRMNELGCHHLPVLLERKVIGVLSERDLLYLESFRDVDMTKTLVVEAMIEDPLMVRETDLLGDVAARMVEERVGSVLVTPDGERLTGIFTNTDALKVIAQQQNN